jgi:hypothetical protein
MGPLHNPSVPYVGSTQTIADVHAELSSFADKGNNWPTFLPVYFSGTGGVYGTQCSLKPFNGAKPYELPKLPGMFNMLVLSYLNPPPIPPTLTSDPPNYLDFYADKCPPATVPPFKTPNLGKTGQGVLNLWNKCVTNNSGGAVCVQIRDVYNFFLQNYMNSCSGRTPTLLATMDAVYGFVPITDQGCSGGALKDTTNPPISYPKLVDTYCRLQYNYLTGATGEERFNPYTQLIHQTLQSSAYAFSIDDGVSFKHVKGDGIIFSIVGTNGLENSTATALPNPNNFLNQCTNHALVLGFPRRHL